MKICDFYVYIPMDVDGIDISASESIILSLRLASWKANEASTLWGSIISLSSTSSSKPSTISSEVSFLALLLENVNKLLN